MKLHYNWTLEDTKFPKHRGKVFSCFSGAGGSTMGYKLAGFDVLGCVEIDPKMMEVYIGNHDPKYWYEESIIDFNKRKDLPDELYNLDILDGSPPCTSFSTAGRREEYWGKKKKYAEGKEEQIIDRLFFDFIETVDKLKPKIVIAENVVGITKGEAKYYKDKVIENLKDTGYWVSFFVLDASKMGVPQRRERVFFIAVRKDIAKPIMKKPGIVNLNQPKLNLEFNEKEIRFKEFYAGEKGEPVLDNKMKDALLIAQPGQCLKGQTAELRSGFTHIKLNMNDVLPTLTTRPKEKYLPDNEYYLSYTNMITAFTFPQDFNFYGYDPIYMMGMSVPPIMIAKIVNRVFNQWIKVIRRTYEKDQDITDSK